MLRSRAARFAASSSSSKRTMTSGSPSDDLRLPSGIVQNIPIPTDNMEPVSNSRTRRKLTAFVLPMAIFVGLLGLVSLLKIFRGPFWIASPQYWIFPLQTIICGGLLIFFWREYDLRRARQVFL